MLHDPTNKQMLIMVLSEQGEEERRKKDNTYLYITSRDPQCRKSSDRKWIDGYITCTPRQKHLVNNKNQLLFG